MRVYILWSYGGAYDWEAFSLSHPGSTSSQYACHRLGIYIKKPICGQCKEYYSRELYTKYDIYCHQLLLSCSILIVNRSIVSRTLNANPPLNVIPCKIFRGDCRITMLWLVSLTKWFFIQISIIHDKRLFTSCWQAKVGFWPMDELIHHPWQYWFTYSWEVSSEKLP